jgi:23S rRNA pseudouridine1911/1915/1917 synthase
MKNFTNAPKIKITEDHAGKRLDIFLSEQLNISRSQAQKMIANEQISLDKIITKKIATRLKTGNTIILHDITPHAKPVAKKSHDTSATISKKSPCDSHTIEPAPTNPEIIADTADYIVLNKPSGMLTHPTMAHETNTLADFVTAQYPQIKNVGEDPARPGIVHRLDKEASGLIVVAKTQVMFNTLKEQFKNRSINKEYTALVHGQVARDWGEINFRISRSKTSDRMAALPTNETMQGKEAKTEFTVEKKFINFTLLRVKIYTGRTHQIRVHFLAYDHPLVGDPLYFQKKQKRTWDNKLGRLFLHSSKLDFTDLAGERKKFESVLPKKLADFLSLLT